MAKLIITRSSEWTNSARAIGVYIDGQKAGTIANGATQEYEISEGSHTVKTKIDWCGSKDFTFSVTDGQTKNIFLSSFSYNNKLLFVCTLIIALHFLLHIFFNIDYLVWALVFVFPFLLYYLTFGRNDYLKIKELN